MPAKGRQGEAAEKYCCYFEKRKSVKGLVINEKKVTFVYIFDEQTVKCKLNCKCKQKNTRISIFKIIVFGKTETTKSKRRIESMDRV